MMKTAATTSTSPAGKKSKAKGATKWYRCTRCKTRKATVLSKNAKHADLCGWCNRKIQKMVEKRREMMKNRPRRLTSPLHTEKPKYLIQNPPNPMRFVKTDFKTKKVFVKNSFLEEWRPTTKEYVKKLARQGFHILFNPEEPVKRAQSAFLTK
jgi:hypothetical protein